MMLEILGSVADALRLHPLLPIRWLQLVRNGRKHQAATCIDRSMGMKEACTLSPKLGMFPLVLSVLNRDSKRGYYNPD